jgi:hypothetical protein
MYDKPNFTAVAWIPWSWDPENARATHPLAMTWALQQAAATRTKPILRVHSHAHDWTRSNTYGPYAKVATIVTDRGRGSGHGPTLVPAGHSMKLVAGGMSCARSHALVVEEHPALPLSAWAAELGAINLRTGEVTTDHRNPEQAERVRSMTSSLYNGWHGPPGSSAAKHWMPELAAAGMTWADFVGTILAVAPHHIDEKGMLRWAPPAWKAEIDARMKRNTDPSQWPR